MNRPTLLHWIDGEHHASSSARTFESLNPEDDSVIATAACGDAGDVALAVDSAAQAFQRFQELGPSQREAILLRAAELLQQRSANFRDLLIREIGSPVGKASMEIGIATRVLKANAAMARRMTGRTYSSDVPGRWSLGFRKPLGVVASITPFNVPLIKGIKHSSMPLATGNTVVWLPSQQTPMIAAAIAQLYHDAGLPAGALNMVLGNGAEIGDDLVSAPQIAAACFTGSAAVGRHVQTMCGRHGKRVTLELGGKNPLIVLDDANLDAAVGAAVRGGFIYQGQICMASSRVIVDQSLAEAFTERFVAASESLGMGELTDPKTVIGPIITANARQRIRDHLADAVDGGASILCGNRWTNHRVNPTIVSGVTASMKLFHEETFGPVVSIETANDRQHALELANASPGMLSAAVFTSDLDAVMTFADSLGTAMVHVNDMTIQQEPEVPFGGDGPSGFGREGMETGIEDFTTWKWVTLRN
ncbi:aldehyde dehydrogenase family protein [Stieleria sp. ICT_E10.1]|uniref:aldehyde dehydrogenase family protein n=1 Tax=Stieleria sedimenti TaxID=2976331 RepID=UPI002180282C|nr:aldehyde dehydrogenase family protein [Stieleria sedimenti]MCS7471559.1 aldehyde dehydrogenase family protein [Stieleria sedimenti]